MPRRDDIQKVLLIGSGPIVIGQACEFDYSGTQACKALREEGYDVVLVNSNPATIMTDPETAERTYIEPLTAEVLERIIARERPDVILPTLGGQTALNLAVELAESGVLDRYRVELIGASLETIRKAEDRDLFKRAMESIGMDLPAGGIARSLAEAREIAAEIGFPVIIRPAFTMGGSGGSTAYNVDELEDSVAAALAASPIGETLLEESIAGWKEFELEVVRDRADNVVIVCSIENLDPMGVHTGDSITVAPAQTLTDREYQLMRDAALAIIREIGVETGGCNVQFAVDPATGRLVVIEVNPRVSRSSALASKATGFPIAKIAAKLAIGYTLDEIRNDITVVTPASFEPVLDYVVVKVPRWNFEKFPGVSEVLGTQMKSVGEAMAIGGTFKEALSKALRSLEIDRYGLGAAFNGAAETAPSPDGAANSPAKPALPALLASLRQPRWDRIFRVAEAFRLGATLEEVQELTGIDPWFLDQIQQILETEDEIAAVGRLDALDAPTLRRAKAIGLSDRELGRLLGAAEAEVRRHRRALGVRPVMKTVDTCAAEFAAHTPYHYSTYTGTETEVEPSDRRKVLILGGGPNRIGQGIEFDYCCVHCVQAFRGAGWETILLNSNPETVSTDYDTSDRLYFEPLTLEDILEVVDAERPDGVVVQFGGQTPLKLALALEAAGVPILGTSPGSIDRAEDRKKFLEVAAKLDLTLPPSGTVRTFLEARALAERIGYPVLVRPSYVLGGRAMRIVYDDDGLKDSVRESIEVSPDHPVQIDRFLEDAFEFDVDAVADGERCVIAGVMQHIEEAGIHSGDSACVLPPYRIRPLDLEIMRSQMSRIAKELDVRGLLNAQFAIKDDIVYLLEVNPRASRTVPFVAKAVGAPIARIAARVMAGETLAQIGFVEEPSPGHVSVKEAVLPFAKFAGTDPFLGPEMKSTGEVMGMADGFGEAFAKSQMAAGDAIPMAGTAFLSMHDQDHDAAVPIARELARLKFRLCATSGTAHTLREAGLACEGVPKLSEGRPNAVDRIANGEIHHRHAARQGVSRRGGRDPARRDAKGGARALHAVGGGGGRAGDPRALRPRHQREEPPGDPPEIGGGGAGRGRGGRERGLLGAVGAARTRLARAGADRLDSTRTARASLAAGIDLLAASVAPVRPSARHSAPETPRMSQTLDPPAATASRPEAGVLPESVPPKRFLVTGGAGFLGINLVRYLRQRGHEVTSLDFAPFDYPDMMGQIRIVDGDIRDRTAVDRAMEGVDIVVHTAAALPLYQPEDIMSTDLEGTRVVFESAHAAGVKRAVHISSTAVYGIPDHHPLLETDDLHGVGPYGVAKVKAEEVCAAFRDKGMCVPIIRPKSFIGPERLGVFALLYDWAKDGKGFPMIGTGKNRYQLLDVEDLCQAIYLCAFLDEKMVDDVFNVGAKEFLTMREDYQAVLDRAGFGKRIVGTPAGPIIWTLRILEAMKLSPLYKWVYETACEDSFVSIEKAERVLGFAPRFSNRDALVRNYEWYLANLASFENASGVSHRVPWKQGILGLFKRFF